VNRSFILVVGNAAAEERALAFDELERWERPVLRLRLDHVDVRKEKNRLLSSVPAAQARDEVSLLWRVLEHDNVGVGEAHGLEPHRHRASSGERAAGTLGRVDLDQLLEEAASN